MRHTASPCVRNLGHTMHLLERSAAALYALYALYAALSVVCVAVQISYKVHLLHLSNGATLDAS